MKKNYKFLIILLLIIFGNKVLAAPANSSFTNDEFYNCIIVKLNTDGFNSTYDRDASTYNVTKEELESITVLKCNESNIDNVKGLELLTNLTDLNLSDNNISAIDLTKNTKITNLLLSNNKLSTIDLAKNTLLENLYLNGNKLTSLNLNNNRNLLVLNINNNKLSSLDLSNNDKVIDLKASDNAFNVQSKLVFKGESTNLTSIIKLPTENENIQSWLTPTWITKDANIATVNQKGTVKADKSGEVNIIATVEDVYSITYNVKVSEVTSDVYNIDDVNSTIAVDNANISTILNNLKVVNGELMIYNASNKYVTSGNIASGFKLKVMQNAQVLKTYTLNLVQTVVNNDLASLEVKNYNIDFDKDKTNYTLIVENTVDALEVVAKAVEDSATIEITGNNELVSGTNTINITITGKDKTTKTYSINVIKKASEEEAKESTSNVYLGKLEVKGHDINFDQKIDYYDIKIDSDVEVLEITAKPSDDQATVKINGNSNLKNKSKIEIVVSATDGSSKTYILNIQKANSKNFKTILTILELIALFLMVLLCIILIIKHNKKQKKQKNKTPEEKKEVQTEKVIENTIEISKKKIETITKSEAYLEKTIRFRRVCPKCGSINVLTNDNCYLCGAELSKEDLKK